MICSYITGNKLCLGVFAIYSRMEISNWFNFSFCWHRHTRVTGLQWRRWMVGIWSVAKDYESSLSLAQQKWFGFIYGAVTFPITPNIETKMEWSRNIHSLYVRIGHRTITTIRPRIIIVTSRIALLRVSQSHWRFHVFILCEYGGDRRRETSTSSSTVARITLISIQWQNFRNACITAELSVRNDWMTFRSVFLLLPEK